MFPGIMVSVANAITTAQPCTLAEPKVPPTRGWSRAQMASFAGCLLLAGGIYASIWVSAIAAHRSKLPPIFSADFYAYLNFSRVFKWTGTSDHDPWYGVPIAPQFGYSMFRAAFVLFGGLSSMLGGDVPTSVLWTAAWSVLIACSVWLLLRSLLKDASALVLFAACSTLLFVSLNTITLSAWVHPFNSVRRDALTLPYVRTFFPQIAIPLLALYLINCKNAWDKNRLKDYLWMAVAQFVAFVSFPYASVLMAMVTAIFIALNIRRSELKSRLLRFTCVGASSMLLDAGYLWWAWVHSAPVVASISHGGPLLRLDWLHFRMNFGGTLILLLLLASMLLALRGRESSFVIAASLGLGNALMLLADCVVDSRFLVSHHAGYFVQISLGVQTSVLLWHLARRVSSVVLRPAVAAIAVCCVLNGVLASWITEQKNAESNARLSAFANVLAGLQLNSTDLIVAPSTDVNDVSTFVPLLSKAHVLYTREAEMLLGAAQQQETERHAAYLYLTGRKANWVAESIALQQFPYIVLTVGQGFTLQDPRRRSEIAEELRETLLPALAAIEHGAKPSFLQRADRIVVLDSATNPLFDESRLTTLLAVSNDYLSGRVRVRVCTTR